jgi:hypothetical protein
LRLALLSLLCVGATFARQTRDQLTREEDNRGWVLLFDGTTIAYSEVVKLLAGQRGKDCVIRLHNHADEAWFRDIKIRRFQLT